MNPAELQLLSDFCIEFRLIILQILLTLIDTLFVLFSPHLILEKITHVLCHILEV